jgi:hypothetical protein
LAGEGFFLHDFAFLLPRSLPVTSSLCAEFAVERCSFAISEKLHNTGGSFWVQEQYKILEIRVARS